MKIHLKLKLFFVVSIINMTSLSFLYATPILNSPIGLQSYTHKILDNQNVCVKELSGLTYNTDSELLMAIGDAGMLLEWNVKKRMLNSESNLVSCSNSNSVDKFYDTEAIVHIGGNVYAIMEEREAKMSFVRIDASSSMVDFPIDATFTLHTNMGTAIPSCDNLGLEGLAYDKVNKDYYTIKQAGSPELFTFQTVGNFGTAGINSVTDLTTITISPTQSLTLESVHGLHFDESSGNLLLIGTKTNGNTNHGDNDRILIELTTSGTYVSHLDLELDLPQQFENESSHNIEGITMIDDLIILVGEGPNGYANSKMYYLSKSAAVKSPIGLQSYVHKILDNQHVGVKELSGLTYNSDYDLLMGIGDAGMLLEYRKEERILSSASNGAGCSGTNSATNFYDTEAIVHIACHDYAIIEEREAKISFVTIDENTNTVNFPSNATVSLQSNNIPSCDNIGLEGIAYDKMNETFYTIKQAGNPALFSFQTEANSGTETMSLITNLANIIPSTPIESVHGIHFDEASGNLLLIGTKTNNNSDHGDNDRILIELKTTGAYVSHLDLELDLPSEFGNGSTHNIEGVTMIGDLIVLVGEGPSSSSDSKMYYLSKSNDVTLDIKVFLEGCFDETTGMMETNLFDKNVLPGQSNNPTHGQPYTTAPFNYTGMEGANWSAYQNNMVDWVLVSLREEKEDKQFLTIPGILRNDGQVIFPYPNPKDILFSNFLTRKEFYITIQHRNHMMIMSDRTCVCLHDLSIGWDFTIADSYKDSSFGQSELGQYYCMAGGDIDQVNDGNSASIDGQDKLIWEPISGNFNIYSDADTNMDADVNGGDKIPWSRNNGLFNTIKEL